MKKSLSVVICASLAALLVSCANVFDTALVKNEKSAEKDPGKVTISLQISDMSTVSRQILPSDWDLSSTGNAKDLTYVLTGFSDTQTPLKTTTAAAEVPTRVLSFTNLVDGTGAEFSIYPGNWTLFLTAYKTNASGYNATYGDPVLQGYGIMAGDTDGTLDFSTGGGTVIFNLKPVYTYIDDAEDGTTGMKKGTGTPVAEEIMTALTISNAASTAAAATDGTGHVDVQLNFKYEAATDILASSVTGVMTKAQYEAFLADETDVTFTDEVYDADGVNGTPATGYNGAVIYQGDLPASKEYYFVALFYDKACTATGHSYAVATDGHLIGAYIDTLVVDGGNESQVVINSSKEGILNKPAADPKYCAVSTVFTNTAIACKSDGTETLDGTVPDSFNAQFTWEDSSDNELGFQLVITDNTTPAANVYVLDATHTADANVAAVKLATGSSLTAGNTTCVVEGLPTGKTYTATISAYNWLDVNGGETVPVYTQTTAAIEDTYANVKALVDAGTTPSADQTTFGMFTYTYYLKGGHVLTADGLTTDDATYADFSGNEKQNGGALAYVVGYNYLTTAQNVMEASTYIGNRYGKIAGTAFPRIEHPENSKFYVWSSEADLSVDDAGTDPAVKDQLEIAASNTDNHTVYAVWKSISYAQATFPVYSDISGIALLFGRTNGDTIVYNAGEEVEILTNQALNFANVKFTVSDNKGRCVKVLSDTTDSITTPLKLTYATTASPAGAKLTWDTAGAIAAIYNVKAEADFTYKDSQTGNNVTATLSQQIYVKIKN